MQNLLVQIKYFFIIIFLFNALTIQAQIANDLDKRIVYQLNYQPDSTDSKRLDTEYFLLDFSENSSVFRSEPTHLKDSILNSSTPNNLFGTRKTPFKYTLVKSLSTNLITSYYDYTTFKFIVDEESKALDWQITDETKDIMGYLCLSATTSYKGRDYKAYFTEEIPFSDGPYKFKGLPGMILELVDTKQHYHFKAVALLNLPTTFDYFLASFEDYKKASDKELREFEQKVKEKPSLILMNPGIQLPPEAYEKYDRNHRERNKSLNNPIELTND